MSDSEVLLTCSELAKDYGDGHGLDPLDLDVSGGEVVMLVGPNGAGKSTFLSLAAGAMEPSGGLAVVAGQPVGSDGARAVTSHVPDNPVLYDDLSVDEHLEYVARLHGTSDWEDYADELLSIFELTHRRDDLPSTFSRGLRQKTALAVGLVRPFSLLLVDEPFAGLDRPAQRNLVEVFADLADQGAAIVVSTHQLDLLEVATRCVGLVDGALAYDGKPSRDKVLELTGA